MVRCVDYRSSWKRLRRLCRLDERVPDGDVDDPSVACTFSHYAGVAGDNRGLRSLRSKFVAIVTARLGRFAIATAGILAALRIALTL